MEFETSDSHAFNDFNFSVRSRNVKMEVKGNEDDTQPSKFSLSAILPNLDKQMKLKAQAPNSLLIYFCCCLVFILKHILKVAIIYFFSVINA